jgi:hypothetical protein
MHADVVQALHLQELDANIHALRAEISALPKQIAEIEKALGSHLKKLELDKSMLAANQRDRKKLETDNEAQRQKISKLKDQMTGAKTNEQYRAFQKEIEYCEAEIHKADDRSVELMEDAEQLQTNAHAAEVALAEERKVVDGRKQEAKAHTAEFQAKLTALLAERAKLAAKIAPPLLATYERLHKRMRDGRPVARVTDDACGACNMTIRQQYLADLKLGSEILACENCRRILYYDGPPVEIVNTSNE